MKLAYENRDPLMPRRPKGMGAGLTLAIFAHVLLIIAIAFGVNWRSHEPSGIEAELWAATPQAAAPRETAPEPQPQPQPQPKPQPQPTPPAEKPAPPPPAPDPQIAIEKAKQEQKKLDAKRQQEEQEKAKREKQQRDEQAKRDDARREAERQKDEAEKKKQAAADAAKQAAAREAYLKRIQGMAGATGGATDTGSALQSKGPSAGYAGRIMARIKPNVFFNDSIDGNPSAIVEVKVAPDGTIIGKRLVQSSGVKAWDDAVLRAIDKTETLPRDTDGSVPSPMQLVFKPKDIGV